MSDIALQIERTTGGFVAVSNNVIFNTIVNSSGNISYNNTTGLITLNETGRYVINWWVAVQSSQSTNGTVLALSSSQGDLLRGTSPIKTDEVMGVGIIDTVSAPVTVSLVNISTTSLFLGSQVPLTATLVVVKNDTSPGPTGPTGPAGPTGPTGDTGPTGPAGVMSGTMTCFAVAQMSNILSQMITTYSATTWTVFTPSLYSYNGMPLELYTSPDAQGPGILRLIDVNNDYEAIPIDQIAAIYPGDGTVYNPSFTYLTAPDPLPSGCDTDVIAAIKSYLPLNTDVTFGMGASISASGAVYRNEYGVIVLSDADGNTPVFVATPQIQRIFVTGAQNSPTSNKMLEGSGKKPSIVIKKDALCQELK